MPAKNPASKNRKPSRLDAKPAVKKKGAKSSSVIPPKKLSALAAAAQVLGETKQPMSCPELIAVMAAHCYWTSPSGKTPAATLAAALHREIVVRKDQARFQKTGPGRYALA